MSYFSVRAQQFIEDRDERGAAMAEYGLLLAFVALAAIAILVVFGNTLKSTFSFANDVFTNAPRAGTSGTTTTATTTATTN